MRSLKKSFPAKRIVLINVYLGCAMLLGCAHPAPVLHGRVTTISGRGTGQLSEDEATRKVLVVAAAITLDHGYRYFEIAGPVRPGADVTVRIYGTGEISPKRPGVWDADAVAAGQFSPQSFAR